MPGFLASADFIQQVGGPCGKYFNYADSGGNIHVQPAMYWIAEKRGDPSLLWTELNIIRQYLDKDIDMQIRADRFKPFILLWAPANPVKVKPTHTHWQADGKMPVAFHRSDWETDATFAAIKGGSPLLNHAHMDVGSFIFEMNGIRWAEDLGSISYHEA